MTDQVIVWRSLPPETFLSIQTTEGDTIILEVVAPYHTELYGDCLWVIAHQTPHPLVEPTRTTVMFAMVDLDAVGADPQLYRNFATENLMSGVSGVLDDSHVQLPFQVSSWTILTG